MVTKQTTNTSSRLKRNYFIHASIAVILMIFFRFIPPFGEMTPLGMELLGIFLGVLWAWIKCDLIWPSVLAFIFFGFSSYTAGASAALAGAFSNNLVQLILWLLIFAAILTVSGISEQIAHRLIASKLTKGRPWVLSVIILLACYIASAFGAAFAGMLICWDFIYMISKQVGYTKEDKWPKMMIAGVVFTSAISMVTMPFTIGVVATFGYLSAASDGLFGTFNNLNYLIFSLIFSVVILAIYLLINKIFVRPPMDKLKNADGDSAAIPAFNTKQKIALLALVALLVVTILPSMMPTGIKSFMNTIGTPAFVLAICAFITIPKDKEGKQYYTFQELANNGLYWNMLFMIATAFTLGTALAVGDTGFNATFIQWFMPIFSGTGPYLFTMIVCIASIILTNLINNAIAGAIMIPLMYSFAATIGANPLLITVLVIFCTDIGLLLPSSGPFGALLAGNEWVNTKDVFFQSSLGILSTIIAIAVVGIPLGNLMF